VISGGGEMLRDEQLYLTHKAANPSSYAPCEEILARNGNTKKTFSNIHQQMFNC
jgi:hypothetical protein